MDEKTGRTSQTFAVVLVATSLSYLTDHLGFRSGWNALWMFGFPVAVATAANRDAASRCLAALVLPVISLIAMMGTAAVFGLGQ